MIVAYSACFYDWVISLDQEVALIYPAPWNSVKAAYIFCRFYPMAIAPFHLWGLVGNHEQSVCESYYHVLSACAMPTLLSAQFILMLRTYAFSGRKTWVLVVLSISYLGLTGVIIWVLSKELTRLSPLFFFTKRNACFGISDEPDITVLAASVLQGKGVPAPIAYHMGMISVLATFFDCLNMLVVLWHWVRGRDTFGPLGKSFLKQGMLVYVIMTALNTLAICAFLSPYLVRRGLASSSLFANILPSALACRLVLMLRQKASPTETKLRLEYSHMVDNALEMIAVDRCPEELSEGGFTLSISTDAETQH
ncbi:hypothetical protein EDB92DRAFT_1886740 [Lactarius akahatsu]|uniref:DUF6533 domain-containing protein n=1 Tax=Lactarius akahatsu TaxID=416441 RepID=A0AAD4QA57_9AGAM|nr:hypothetical protein EDB92DRAFT_1886740 [Lactarius akahatsu]